MRHAAPVPAHFDRALLRVRANGKLHLHDHGGPGIAHRRARLDLVVHELLNRVSGICVHVCHTHRQRDRATAPSARARAAAAYALECAGASKITLMFTSASATPRDVMSSRGMRSRSPVVGREK